MLLLVLAVTKFSYSSFGVCLSDISCKVSTLFLTVTIYLFFYVGYRNIHETYVTANNSTNNKVVFSIFPITHMAVQKQGDQHEHTFSNYMRIRDVVQKTCLRRWTIGKSGERGSGISVLVARHDDDDDDDDNIITTINSLWKCLGQEGKNVFRH